MKVYIGFYTYLKVAVENLIIADDLKRDNFAVFMREILFRYDSDTWSLIISRDGLIQYRQNDLEQRAKRISETWEEDMSSAKDFGEVWAEYLRDLNIIYFFLDCIMHKGRNMDGLEFSELSYRDICRVTYNDNLTPQRQTSYGGENLEKLIRFGNFQPKDLEILPKMVVPLTAFKELCEYYLEKINADISYKILISRVAKSLSEHNLKNYDNSVVLSWFVLESYISKKWDELILAKGITGQRKEKLKKGNDYRPAAVRTEILQLNGAISEDMYNSLNRVRGSRNDIAHNYTKPIESDKESKFALELVRDVAREITGVELPFNIHGFPTHGL